MKRKLRIVAICLGILLLVFSVPIPVRYSTTAFEFKASDPSYTGQFRMVTVDGYYFINTWRPNRFMGQILVEGEEGTQQKLDLWLEGGIGDWEVRLSETPGSSWPVYMAFFRCKPLMKKLVIYPYQPVEKDENRTYYDWAEEMPALFVGARDRDEAMDWLQGYQNDLNIIR